MHLNTGLARTALLSTALVASAMGIGGCGNSNQAPVGNLKNITTNHSPVRTLSLPELPPEARYEVEIQPEYANFEGERRDQLVRKYFFWNESTSQFGFRISQAGNAEGTNLKEWERYERNLKDGEVLSGVHVDQTAKKLILSDGTTIDGPTGQVTRSTR